MVFVVDFGPVSIYFIRSSHGEPNRLRGITYRPVEPDPVNTGVGIEELLKTQPPLISTPQIKEYFYVA